MTRREFAKKVALYLASASVPRWGFPSIVDRSKRITEKPSGALCMNWGHPLATGMVLCVPFNEGGGIPGAELEPVVYDVVGGGQGDLSGIADASWVENTPGRGIKLNNAGSFIRFVGPSNGTVKLSASMSPGATVLLIRRKTDTTVRNSRAFGISLAVDAALCSSHCPYTDSKIYWDFGGKSGNNRLISAVLNWATTPVQMFAFSAGPKGSAIWKDGVKVASHTNAISRTVAGEMRLNDGDTTNGDLQEFYFFAISNVQWSDDMITWWFAEPYAMLHPQAPSIRYFLGGLGATHRTVILQ